MDLKELYDTQNNRHPWETSRLKAVKKILMPYLFAGIKALDVGCGDGFISRELFRHLKDKEITAVDIHLTGERIQELENLSVGITYLKKLPEEGSFDLILLLDVIEHLEDDLGFLTNLVDRYILKGGVVMITAPSFQSLYSGHDVFLGHHRRYRLGELEDVSKASGLKVISSGHLFLSLLLPKLIFYKLLNSNKGSDGVGRWSRGIGVTRFFEKFLNMDNNLLISASRLGIKLPGLTGWVLCEKL